MRELDGQHQGIELYVPVPNTVMIRRFDTILAARPLSGGDQTSVRWFVMKSASAVMSLPLHRSTVVESTLCSASEYSEVCRV